MLICDVCSNATMYPRVYTSFIAGKGVGREGNIGEHLTKSGKAVCGVHRKPMVRDIETLIKAFQSHNNV